ncbi:MAG: hypothetical protein WAM60_24865 [Candidatus Promineifilaceae bacterium]
MYSFNRLLLICVVLLTAACRETADKTPTARTAEPNPTTITTLAGRDPTVFSTSTKSTTPLPVAGSACPDGNGGEWGYGHGRH